LQLMDGMREEKDLPPPDDHSVDHEVSTSQPVDESRWASRENASGKSTTIIASGAILSSEQVGEFMMSLGTQDNVNHRQHAGAFPSGAFPLGPLNEEGDDVTINVSGLSDLPIDAHLAPDEDDIEARIKERVKHQINQRLHERMAQPVVVSGHIVVADEVKDEPIRESTIKERRCFVVILLFLVVASGLGGIVYWRLSSDREHKVLSAQVGPLPPSSAPSEASSFDFDSLDPLVEELKPFIAPTQEGLFPFMDATSPQSQALVWLQDDPIVLTPGRSTRTLLERYILAVLYYTTNGPSWINHHLNRDDDVCLWNDQIGENMTNHIWDGTWNGVGCSSIGGSIDSLSFPRNNLVGPVPWELILLTNLKVINLNANRLSGSIPTRISELTALETFWVGTNRLTGLLPATFSPSMLSVDMSRNMLTGSFPERWGTSMPELHSIDISLNTISGSIPRTIGQLSNMAFLYVNENQLTGTVPTDLGQLTLLEKISLRVNLFTGSLPSHLDQLSSLETMDIAENAFVGSLNETICGLAGLSWLSADCGEVDCPCCSSCCVDDQGSVCQDMSK
jgi:hypothetical protein